MDITITDIQYPNNDHDGFNVYVKSGTGAYQFIVGFPKTETSYTLQRLSPTVQQCIQLAAYNSFGVGPMSDEVCTGNPPPTQPPTGKPTFTIMIIL